MTTARDDQADALAYAMRALFEDGKEKRWLDSADVDWLLGNAPGLSDRKLRLFAVGCCRHVWDRLTDGRSRNGVEVAERFADGMATEEELASAADASWEAEHPGYRGPEIYWAAAATWEASRNAAEAVGWDRAGATASVRNAALFRAITGNPFRPVTIDPRWLTASVLDLANAIYDGRAWERLPVLADALEDAGCDNEMIIDHCRADGPRARGDWVVDLILGRE